MQALLPKFTLDMKTKLKIHLHYISVMFSQKDDNLTQKLL